MWRWKGRTERAGKPCRKKRNRTENPGPNIAKCYQRSYGKTYVGQPAGMVGYLFPYDICTNTR